MATNLESGLFPRLHQSSDCKDLLEWASNLVGDAKNSIRRNFKNAKDTISSTSTSASKARPNLQKVEKPKTEKPDAPPEGMVRLINQYGEKSDIPVTEFINGDHYTFRFGDKNQRARAVMMARQKVLRKIPEPGKLVTARIKIDGKETVVKSCVVASHRGNGSVIVITPEGDCYGIANERVSSTTRDATQKITPEQKRELDKWSQ